MITRDVFHGVDGDKMLALLETGYLKPDVLGRLFFAQSEFASTFMHGADPAREGSLSFKIRIEIPEGATIERDGTPGVRDTLVMKTNKPVKFEVLEMYFRPKVVAGESVELQKVVGAGSIKQSLLALVKVKLRSDGTGERSTVDLATGRARLRRRSGGFVNLGLSSAKGLNKQRTTAGALLFGMTIGTALKVALDCRNQSEQEKDLTEWEQWIERQQTYSPSTGYLLAVQYSIYTMGPAEPVVRYVLTTGYPASTIEKASQLMRMDPPDNLLVRSGKFDAGQFIYPEPMLHWYPPSVPVAVDVPNQKLRAILAAMEPPSDEREAFKILDGASMSELLEIYAVLVKAIRYSALWHTIDHANIVNKNRLKAAVKAVRAKQNGLSFGNYRATAGIQLPAQECMDYKALTCYFGLGSETKTLPLWLQRWWTVYDGNYYFYYFSESLSAVYTKIKPAGGNDPAPRTPANRGIVALTENGCKITWNPIDSRGPTIESFSQLHGKGNEMNGVSNKYAPLFARKME